MARRGSLPWLILAAIICVLFGVFLDGAFVEPTVGALEGTETWQTNHNSYAYQGKMMVADFVANLLIIFAFGIGIGLLIDARRAV